MGIDCYGMACHDETMTTKKGMAMPTPLITPVRGTEKIKAGIDVLEEAGLDTSEVEYIYADDEGDREIIKEASIPRLGLFMHNSDWEDELGDLSAHMATRRGANLAYRLG